MEWSLFDDNLDIALGIEWRAWGLGVTTSIYGDLNTFYAKLGPLFFTVTYWRLLKHSHLKRLIEEMKDDNINQG